MSTVGTPDIEPTPEVGSSHIPSATSNTALLKNKKKRLASDVIGQLEDALKEDDRDVATWLELISKIEAKDKTEQVRETYEAFLKKFPFMAKQWISYLTYELNRGEFDKVEALLQRSVQKVPSVELWKTYVNYIRRKNNLITGGEEARRVIFQAYDVAVSKVGFDPEAGSLWEEYFSFIEDWKPVSTWDGQQKMDLKRKVFKKALQVPLNNLETLWSAYTAFENDLSTATARKFIGETSGAYMNARSWYKEWSNLTAGLNRSESFIPKHDQYDPEQLQKWMTWIKWEKLNKLELEQEVLIDRVDYIFKQAIQYLTFYPELWFEYANFYKENETSYSNTSVQELLNESILVNPYSFALNFRLIESYELDNNASLVSKKFNTLIENLTHLHNKRSLEIDELKLEAIGDDPVDEEGEVKPRSEEEKESIVNNNKEIQFKLKELKKLSKAITLTYCQYVKSTKRLSGMKESRQIFSLCRASKKTLTHHIFVEVANIEYFAVSAKIAIKVFELGLKAQFFGNDGEYIYKYLKFLIKINDDTNSRSLFETTINTKKTVIEERWLKQIFKAFIGYEMNFGQLSSVEKLEKKYNEFFPSENKILVFADRYSFADLEDGNDDDDLIRFNDLKYSELVPKHIVSSKRKFQDGESNGEDEYGSNKRHQLLNAGNSNGGSNSNSTGGDSNSLESSTNNNNNNNDNNRDEEEDEEDEHNNKIKQYVTDEVYNLLRVLPNSTYFSQPIVNNSKLIALLNALD